LARSAGDPGGSTITDDGNFAANGDHPGTVDADDSNAGAEGAPVVSQFCNCAHYMEEVTLDRKEHVAARSLGLGFEEFDLVVEENQLPPPEIGTYCASGVIIANAPQGPTLHSRDRGQSSRSESTNGETEGSDSNSGSEAGSDPSWVPYTTSSPGSSEYLLGNDYTSGEFSFSQEEEDVRPQHRSRFSCSPVRINCLSAAIFF
jgi:hypothetical protein